MVIYAGFLVFSWGMRDSNQQIDDEYVYFTNDSNATLAKYMPKAGEGDAYAQFKVGMVYYRDEDYENALPWLEKASEQNENHAQLFLSFMYRNENGVEEDEEKYLELLKASADNKNSHAMLMLALDDNYSDLPNKDEYLSEGLALLEKEAGDGEPYAEYRLALYEYFFVEDKDADKIENLLKDSSSKGYNNATLWLGKLYSSGDVFEKNSYRSVSYLEKAAENGSSEAKRLLGLAYYNGNGVSKDLDKAVGFWREAADEGDDNAQLFMGFAYHDGLGSLDVDYQKMVEFSLKSAEQNNSIAQYYLSKAYLEGNGVVKNYEKALEWLTKSAEQNYAQAQLDLGDIYEKKYYEYDGKSDWDAHYLNVAENQKWWRLAAENGDGNIRYEVAERLTRTEYHCEDCMIEAYKWYAVSAAEGNEDAKKQMETWEQYMSPDDIKKAQALALEYMKNNK